MKKILSLSFILLFSSLSYADNFTLVSSDIKHNSVLSSKHVFNGFGCEGENLSPELSWKNAPKDTKSFAVTVYDPDAPTGSGWWHWMVYDIPSAVTKLESAAGTIEGNLLPEGAKQNRIDYGVKAFGGACPPKGSKPHRYIFTVYALKTNMLEVPEDATAALTGYMINANKISNSSFTAYYSR